MQHQHISAGNFHVGSAQSITLEAYLGTCVGVALFDPDARVGGLAHFLLPEPVSATSDWQPEKYAASGMPIFLEALYKAGARSGSLRATLAGGALVGPVDDMDLALDIGGRTAETAERILRAEGIRFDRIETGGFFSCCIQMDLQDGACRIEPSGVAGMNAARPALLPAEDDIERAFERLQPVPQAALKIMRLIDQEEYDTRILSSEVRHDQVLSARTLQLANSVMFATRNRIESIDHALMFLGVNLFMKFVVTAAVEAFYSQSESGYSLVRGGLYHHATGTGLVAERLARLTGAAKPGQAYTAGLLHDIGKVVLDQFMAGAAPLFYRRLIEEKASDFTQAEQAVFGTTHTKVGHRLAQHWSFPDSLAEAIRWHHCPEQSRAHAELSHIVFLANLIMSRFHSGLEIESHDSGSLAPRLEAVGLSLARLPAIVDSIPLAVFEPTPAAALTG
jgi:putative nucleotidyltransferase with HDIG domain